MKPYPLASSSWGEEEKKILNEVINYGNFTMGRYVQEFEKKFAEYLDNRYCIMVNSGSSANLLSIASLFYLSKFQLKKGDEVIVPAVSWSTTYYPLYQYGLKLKFVDVDINTLNYDIDILMSAVTQNTRAIIAVNLLGNPNEFNKIKEIIGGENIFLIEDNCESLGATYCGKQTGTFGIMGTFSFFFSHHISTMEGGIITTNDEEVYHILLSLRSHGWTRHLPENNRVTGKKSSNSFEESFKFVLPGYNVRPLEMSGAVGIEQLKKLPQFIEQRRKNATYFQEKFYEHPIIKIQSEIHKSSWFGFSLIIKKDTGVSQKDLINKLQAHGIESRPIVSGNFTNNIVIKYFDYTLCSKLKNADYIHENGLFVGNHHFDIREQIDILYSII